MTTGPSTAPPHRATIGNGPARSNADPRLTFAAKRRPMANFSPPRSHDQRHSRQYRDPSTRPSTIPTTALDSKIPIDRDAAITIALPARGFLP